MHELDCADHGSAFLTYITGKLSFWGASLFFHISFIISQKYFSLFDLQNETHVRIIGT